MAGLAVFLLPPFRCALSFLPFYQSSKLEKMATEQLVTEQFQFLGLNVEKEVLLRCVKLCEEYNLDAESFIEQWMAFSLTYLNGSSPTLDNLDLLVRKEFSKKGVGNRALAAEDTTSAGASLTIYGAPAPFSSQPDNDVLSNYVTGTPKRVKVEAETTSYQNELGPATYSPNTSHSAKYASRTNSSTVVHSYGDESLLQNIATPVSPTDILNVKVAQIPNEDGELYTKCMFGFELLHEKASIFDNHIRYLSQCIMKKAGITESVSVRNKTQTEVAVVGRIECDADARLNPKSVVLQGTWEASLSQAVPVDLENLSSYSLFPGQVVVLTGANPRGDRFVPTKVYHDASLPQPDYKADMLNAFKGTLSLLTVAGPYTPSDNMSYEPLKDLVSYINTHKPHVVIMTGPFMDCDHAKIKDNSMAETYKSFFEKLMDSLGELSTTSPYTKIYIVSSPRDVFHVNIYPSPPYSCRRKHTNIHFVPDPCSLNIGGVVVAVTSTDALMHLGQEEIALNTGSDKLARLAAHVLQQQCPSPLWPARAPSDAALAAAHAQLPCTPHVLVLPSHFRYFVKDVKGCVVVNPEHLTKGPGGGTFGRLLISTVDDELKIAAQIVRI